ncbi:MAG: AAC(3) family N-acetyltransferase [Armatimonadetes bacterium]|nr:AAC(3) family N-acetyltransferase [Armatimonadota bacterium]
MPCHVTAGELRDGLRTVGLGSGDTVLVHSSLSAFGWVEGGADAVIDALLEVLGPAGTLVMPTFTWGPNHAAPWVEFDVANTPCETGRIPDTFRRRPGVLRGEHVCHSFAACGLRAAEVLGDGIHPFWRGGFEALYRLDAWNLFLGVSLQCCTALHAAEELARVPYRSYRDYAGSVVILPDGSRVPSRAIEYLRQDGSRNDFAKMEEVFDSAGVLRHGRIGNARVLNVRIREVIDCGRELLEADPYALSSPPP